LIPVPDARGHEALVQALLSARQHGAQAIAEEWSQALSEAGDAYAVQDAVAEALGWFAGSRGRCAPVLEVGRCIAPSDADTRGTAA
jgi:hypothetical protein